MPILRLTLVTSFVLFLSACGSLPDVEVGYYLPKASLNLTATQTAKCLEAESKGDAPRPYVITKIEFTPSYSSDLSRGLHFLKVEDFEGDFSKGHFEITLTDDGRLQSFGTEGTSQISEGLKTAVDLVSLGFGADFLRWKSNNFLNEEPSDAQKMAAQKRLKNDYKQRIKSACDDVERLGGDKKILSVVRTAKIEFEAAEDDAGNYVPGPVNLEVTENSIGESNFEGVVDIFGELMQSYSVEPLGEGQIPYKSNAKKGKHNRITLVEPERAIIKVVVERLAKPNDWVQDIFTTNIFIPQFGETYEVEVPKVPTFGSVATTFKVAENGKLTNLKYTSDPGAAGAQGAIGTIQGLKKEDEATDPIAAAKAQSDLIYQQQRLIRCQTDPADCPG